MSFLDVEGLTVSYGGIVAVRKVSLSVSEGAVTLVAGPNGAGKTSMLRGIMGFVDRSGIVSVDGKVAKTGAPHRMARSGVALVPEGRHVFAPLSVLENLLLGAYSERSRSRRNQRLEKIYSMFPILHERARVSAGLLSGGEQQMLAFGRALMSSPRVMLLDEPSMGLAPSVTNVVMDAVASIAKTGIGVLMVEQNAAMASKIATSMIILVRGEIVEQGSPSQLIGSGAVSRAFLGSEDAAGLAV
jgi:branched-chain amino acid transport system ATP-binding protein